MLSFNSYEDALAAIRAEPYWVKVLEYDDRILLLYNLLSSPTNNEITNDCRGLILSKDFKTILSRPFKRFYNYKEKDAKNHSFNFENALVQEKADGSLVQVYNDGKKWCAGTKGKAFAEGPQGIKRERTFFELFLQTAEFNEDSFQTFFDSIQEDSSDYTWLFELIGPENRILTPYAENTVRYLDKIHKEYGEFYQVESCLADSCLLERYMKDFERLNQLSENKRFTALTSYTVKNYEEFLEKLNSLELLEEGFVCIENKTGRRVKLKQQSYLSFLKSNISPEAKLWHAIELVFEHEENEYLSIFPEQQPLFDFIKNKYDAFIKILKEEYDKYKDIADRKLFAESIKDSPYKAIFFLKVSKKELSFEEILNNFSDENKAKWIGEVPEELYNQ